MIWARKKKVNQLKSMLPSENWASYRATVRNTQSSKPHCHVLNQIEAIKLEISGDTKSTKKKNQLSSLICVPGRKKSTPHHHQHQRIAVAVSWISAHKSIEFDWWWFVAHLLYTDNWVILNSIFDCVCLEYILHILTHPNNHHKNNNHMKCADWQHRHLLRCLYLFSHSIQ